MRRYRGHFGSFLLSLLTHLAALITVLGLYLGEDYLRQGPELERLDLSRYQAPAGA